MMNISSDSDKTNFLHQSMGSPEAFQAPLQIGVIGCGQWGKNYLRVILELEQTNLVAAYDVQPDVRERIAARYPGVRVYSSLKDLLDDPLVHGVVIATDARSHVDVVSAALRAGKHVLCEKPLALHLEEAVKITRLAEEFKRILMVGHIFRYNARMILSLFH